MRLVVLVGLVGYLSAQIIANDSVSLGAGYAQSVFYHLATQTKTPVLNDQWHIAFSVEPRSVAVRVNDAVGVKLYLYTKGDTSHWNCAQFDTTGNGWLPYYNSDTAWENGAFNNFQNNFDVGWGIYDMISHNVDGDSIYLLQLPNNQWKRIWIVRLDANGTWTIRYSNLDCSNEQLLQIVKNNYPNKRFVYVDLINNQVLDLEPAQWDLLFTRFTTEVAPGMFYLVTGVLQDKDVGVAEVRGIPVDQSTWQNQPLDSAMNVIGYDWKAFNNQTFSYEIVDSLTYFVKDPNGNVYKLVFTGFDGSSTGNIYFYLEKVLSSTEGARSNRAILGVYQRGDVLNVVLYQLQSQPLTFVLYTPMGQKVAQWRIQGRVGMQTYTLELPSVAQGSYLLQVKSHSYHTAKWIFIK